MMEPLQWWGSVAPTSLELLATAAFALSGIIEAARKRMDVVGVCVVAFLTAFGGGTLRDLLLDQRPFFWVRSNTRSRAYSSCVWLPCCSCDAGMWQSLKE